MKYIQIQWRCIVGATFCISVLFVSAQPVVDKNETDKNQAAGKDNKIIDTIVQPTNIIKATDGTIFNEHMQKLPTGKQPMRDLRPFIWLYKHLGDYLMCAYSQHRDCEKQLAKSLINEERSTAFYPGSRLSSPLNAAPLNSPRQTYAMDRSFSENPHYSASRFFGPRPFMGYQGVNDGPRFPREQFGGKQFEFHRPDNEYIGPKALQQPFERGNGPHEFGHPYPFGHQREPIYSDIHVHPPSLYHQRPPFRQPTEMIFTPNYYPFAGKLPHMQNQESYEPSGKPDPEQHVRGQVDHPRIQFDRAPVMFRSEPFQILETTPSLEKQTDESSSKTENKQDDFDKENWLKNVHTEGDKYPEIMPYSLMTFPFFASYTQ